MIINRYAKGGGLSPRIVVTAATGSTVTCTKGGTTLTATEVGGKWTFNLNDFGTWTVNATLGGKSDTKDVDVVWAQLYEVTLLFADATLNNNDWETIKQVADASAGANYWAVGDTKQIEINGKLSDGLTLSNYSTYVYIIGFDHNSEIEGTGIAFGGFKTAQTGGTDICLCGSEYNTDHTSGQWFNMNNNDRNPGGWSGCDMRNNTLPVVKAALPSELTLVIKTTTLYTDNTGGGSDVASYITQTQDELYLLAEYEIFGARTYANTAEQNYQTQYAYYVAGNSKIKYKHDSTATAAYWWERSVYATLNYSFCYVNTGGAASNGDAYYSRGLALAFKVGSNPPAQPISALAVGSSVFCNVNGVKTEFIVVNQGKPNDMYDDSCDGSWLLMKNCYERRQWHSSNSNSYNASTIHSYLNGTFLNLFDSNIKDAIKRVKIPYVNGTGSSAVASGANGLPCKVFLLSGYEVGFTTSDDQYFPQDGVKLSYFESGTGTSANGKRIASRSGSTEEWWLRSPYTDNTSWAWGVSPDGSYNSGMYASTSHGVRPAFIVPFDTIVSGDGTIQV